MTPASLLKFKAVPPAWILPSVLLMALLDRWWPIYEWLPAPWHRLGYLALALSLLITGMGARRLARSHTTIYPAGEPSALVTTGIYQFTRNPMYLGMALILLCVAMLFGSVSALLGVPFFMVVVQHLFIYSEERRLHLAFGDAYQTYCGKVRRWL